MSPILITIGLWIANILFGLLLLFAAFAAVLAAGVIFGMMKLWLENKRKGNKDV